jgi:hypothetical protein
MPDIKGKMGSLYNSLIERSLLVLEGEQTLQETSRGLCHMPSNDTFITNTDAKSYAAQILLELTFTTGFEQ